MPTPRVSRAARLRIVERLSNVTTGFTPNLTAALADAGVTAPAGWKLPINYAAPGVNFFQADVAPEDLDGTSIVTYPAQSLYCVSNANRNREKFRMFSGEVNFALNTFCSWKASRLLPDFETMLDCVEEALYITFNGDAVKEWATDDVLVYDGDLSMQRSRLSKGGENWFQTLASRLTVEVHALG